MRGRLKRAKRLHRTAARRRAHALHQFSRRIIDQYQCIYIGDVSSRKLTKTRMAKSVVGAVSLTIATSTPRETFSSSG